MYDEVRASEALKHPLVSTISEHGGVGEGRLIDGKVYQSGGNGWYNWRDGHVVEYFNDNGKLYLDVAYGRVPHPCSGKAGV